MSFNKSKLSKSIQQRGNYSTIPNEIWDLDLDAKSKIVYAYLICQSEKWKPGQRTIAEAVGYSQPAVGSALKELQNAGMLIIHESEKGMRSLYELTGLEDWLLSGDKSVITQKVIIPLSGDKSVITQKVIIPLSGDKSVITSDKSVITSKKNPKKREGEKGDENLSDQISNKLVRSESDFSKPESPGPIKVTVPLPSEDDRNPPRIGPITVPPVSIHQAPAVPPTRISVSNILKAQFAGKDRFERPEEIRACVFKFFQNGYMESDVMNSFDAIVALWTPGSKAKFKDASTREWVIDQIRNDLRVAIAEFYPPAPIPTKASSKVKTKGSQEGSGYAQEESSEAKEYYKSLGPGITSHAELLKIRAANEAKERMPANSAGYDDGYPVFETIEQFRAWKEKKGRNQNEN